MFTEQQLHAIAQALVGREVPDSTVSGVVAFGIEEDLGTGKYAWIVGTIQDRTLKATQVRFVAIDADPDSVLDAESAILAPVDIWRQIAADEHAGVIRAAEQFNLNVSGRLPYFIRHLRSLTELLVIFSKTIPA